MLYDSSASAGKLELGQPNMRNELPSPVHDFILQIEKKHGTRVELREVFPTGKSTAFVALVDCSGSHDGVYVLKVDAIPAGRTDSAETGAE